MDTADLIAFVRAIDLAFPLGAPRDKFGRYSGPRNTDPLRELWVKYKANKLGTAFDTQDQAGMVARMMLQELS